MTTDTQDLTLEVTRRIDAAPEAVFDAWLDPDMLAKFMTPAENMSVPEAKTDPVEGGRFLVLMRAGETDLPHEGTYLTIDRPRRLVFTWESPHSQAENSTVTLTFAPDGNGTLVTLHHVRFVSEGSRDGHKAGWTAILDALAEVL
ncbi:SRPBCC domain-containing protein [Rhodobacterales bacterium HKCCE3408]|nr:SRPBCC domain-containing protein [Rhodobacterales bacterium HKCCE3408]